MTDKIDQIEKIITATLKLAETKPWSEITMENIANVAKIKPALLKKQIVICDRFTDSTIAYQVHGKGVNKNFVNSIHKHILGGLKPDLTFVLKVKISKALMRLKKRKKKNRYDKFSQNFYKTAQNAFIKIAKKTQKDILF